MENDQELQGCTASWPDADHQVRALVLCLRTWGPGWDAIEQFQQQDINVGVLEHTGEPHPSDYKDVKQIV